jgi:hypothetical protein
MGGPTPPSATTFGTPNTVANIQQGYNFATQGANNYNANNPFGSLNYSETTGPNGVPQYTVSQILNPYQQALFNANQNNQITAANQAGTALGSFNPNNPGLQIGNATTGLTGQAVNQQVQYLQPYFNYQTTQLDAQLRNQGIDPSSPAYKQAMMNLQNNQNNTVTGFVSNIEPQMFQQAQQEYTMPLSVAGQEMQLGAPNTQAESTFATGAQAAPPGYESDVANAQNAIEQQYLAQVQQYAGLLGGLGSIGTGLLGLGLSPTVGAGLSGGTSLLGRLIQSDVRLKQDIERVGEWQPGIGLHAFRYKKDPSKRHVGVLAHEVAAVRPDATGVMDDGHLGVDYARLGLPGPVEV